MTFYKEGSFSGLSQDVTIAVASSVSVFVVALWFPLELLEDKFLVNYQMLQFFCYIISRVIPHILIIDHIANSSHFISPV